MLISDTLSRASLPIQKAERTMPVYLIYKIMQDNEEMEAFEQTEPDHHVTDVRLKQIKMLKYPVLQTLMQLTVQGWPDDKLQVPACVREYWPYRDELGVHDGLMYRGTRIVIELYIFYLPF